MKPEDGISVLRRVQQDKLTQGSVFVMLSGLTDVKLLHEGYQLGAHTFMVKPLKVQDVMELLSTLKQTIAVIPEENGHRLAWQNPIPPNKFRTF
jgi:YesN/AraC family two-component response regulator